MSSLSVLRARRNRRLERQRASRGRRFTLLLSAGAFFSLLLVLAILSLAWAYTDLTADLPSLESLPRLLNPPNGLLLQPTRIYDRSGQHLLLAFAPDDAPRRYLPLAEQNPQHLPKYLADAILALNDPTFWSHDGYLFSGWQEANFHPTLAQRLVSDLLLYDEPPSLRRALRERLLAAQVTAHFGRSQVLEWYLNSADFGHNAFGAEAAAQLYFGKSASQLSLAEAAILAATNQMPALNPFDAAQQARQRGREVIYILQSLGWVDAGEAQRALSETPTFQAAPPTDRARAPAFLNLVLAQLESRFPRARLERGGLTVLTTLDFDLQMQAACLTAVYQARLSNIPEPACQAARFLPSLPPGALLDDAVASALILDPNTGQILAAVGETRQGQETPLLAAHRPGSLSAPFVYLTGFTRGLGPASLVWDVPGQVNVQNFDGRFHGPLRLRLALANDYRLPAEVVLQQMGVENVERVAASFGMTLDAPVTLTEVAGAFGAFATQGVYFGQPVGDAFGPIAVLRVETTDHTLWLDWSTPQARSLVSPALAYLINHVLSDEPARWPTWGHPNVLEIGRPAAVKAGQNEDGQDAWLVGYTPQRVVVAWTGRRGEGGAVTPRLPAVLWSGLMQLASEELPVDGWAPPAEISVVNVCDPSGLLPTVDCPNVVSEVFLNGNEPTTGDTLYRAYWVNRETGLLATVFTPPHLVEKRVYLMIPAEERAWAELMALPAPPQNYDAIELPPSDPEVHLSAPAMFAEVSGVVNIIGTAAGDGFRSYRLQVGKGLYPQRWVQVGEEETQPVTEGLLGKWDTRGLSGVYVVQLVVVREDERLETASIVVTVK